MMEMHLFQKAKQVEVSSPDNEQEILVQKLFTFFYLVQDWLQVLPVICPGHGKESRELYVLFRDVAFSDDDFLQKFGAFWPGFYSRWKLDVFGTSFSQDTVWLSLEENEGHFYVVQKTLSGRPEEMIQSLCIRIECFTSKEALDLNILFQSTSWDKGVTVVDWKYHDFLVKEKIPVLYPNSCYCYGQIFYDVLQPDNCLQALSFMQKVEIWTRFLNEGFDDVEFEWLYHEISENILINRIEWELSLHTAMEDLGYTIKISAHGFELYDGQGQRRYFNFNSLQYSERVFLKILFPINF